MPAASLSAEQRKALSVLRACVERGISCALLGAAGSGKTVVLRALLNDDIACRLPIHSIRCATFGSELRQDLPFLLRPLRRRNQGFAGVAHNLDAIRV